MDPIILTISLTAILSFLASFLVIKMYGIYVNNRVLNRDKYKNRNRLPKLETPLLFIALAGFIIIFLASLIIPMVNNHLASIQQQQIQEEYERKREFCSRSYEIKINLDINNFSFKNLFTTIVSEVEGDNDEIYMLRLNSYNIDERDLINVIFNEEGTISNLIIPDLIILRDNDYNSMYEVTYSNGKLYLKGDLIYWVEQNDSYINIAQQINTWDMMKDNNSNYHKLSINYHYNILNFDVYGFTDGYEIISIDGSITKVNNISYIINEFGELNYCKGFDIDYDYYTSIIYFTNTEVEENTTSITTNSVIFVESSLNDLCQIGYKVTEITDDGNYYMEEYRYFSKGETYYSLINPYKEKVVLRGVYLDKDFEVEYVNRVINQDITVYLKWESYFDVVEKMQPILNYEFLDEYYIISYGNIDSYNNELLYQFRITLSGNDFENHVNNDDRWMDGYDENYKAILPDFFNETSNRKTLIYNINTGEYNKIPTINGEFKFVCFVQYYTEVFINEYSIYID